MKIIFSVLWLFLFSVGMLAAEILKGDFEGMPYQLFVPQMREGRQYPLVVCLHGALGRGTDNQGRGIHAYGLLKSSVAQANHPAFLLVPQCAKDSQWVDTPWAEGSYDLDAVPESVYMKKVAGLISRTLQEQPVDAGRVYATGQSMGGFGCWDLVLRHPDLFAAAVPVCGGGSPKHAERIKDLPLWIFHGAKDPTVPVSASREMAAALAACGGTLAHYTEFPEGGHVIMGQAWNAPGLVKWMFEQEKSK